MVYRISWFLFTHYESDFWRSVNRIWSCLFWWHPGYDEAVAKGEYMWEAKSDGSFDI